MKTKSLFLVFTCMTMFVCGQIYGSPIAPWESGTANWQATDISSSPAPYTPDAVTISGTTPTSVTLQFRAVTAGQEASWFPVGKLSTGVGADTLLGDWSSQASSVYPLYAVTFKLTNDDAVTPTGDGLRMYFISEGNTFYSSILTAPLGSQTFTRLLSDFTGFGATTFTTVTEFGFEIASYNSLSAHTYTFEDIGLTQVVPEPETVWMMLVVMASLAITFRQRLADVAGQIKARFVA